MKNNNNMMGHYKLPLVLLLCSLFVSYSFQTFLLPRWKQGRTKISSAPISDCQVLIAGGTTAAFAAALSSASEGVKTCLLEPTDWVGGQMTSSGVPAIDFAWQVLKKGNESYDVPKYDKSESNVTPNLYSILHSEYGHTGQCWVSNFCYLPRDMLNKGLFKLYVGVEKNLKIYLNSVVKRVRKNESFMINQVQVIQRFEKPSADKKCLLLSQELLDWYSEQESDRYHKEVLTFQSSNMIVMDATDWGEILALSGADYLQGLSEQYDGDVSGVGNDTCGQSIVFGFAQQIHQQPTSEPSNPYPDKYQQLYSIGKYTWNQVWTYRRLYTPGSSEAIKGDITLQNWGNFGNDYEFGYLFLPRNETRELVKKDAWNGGLNMNVLRESEYLAYGWHYWFKNASNPALKDYITMDKDAFGTCHGLSQLPYIRDTRRSIGIDDYIIKIRDLTGDFTQQKTGTVPYDHLALGSYSVDIHRLKGCFYPGYVNVGYSSLPFFIPYRAMTNRNIPNLLVAGKVMAQSFLANAATRLHPVEWSSGTAAGAAAAFMVQRGFMDTKHPLTEIKELQAVVEKYTPIRWTIDGNLYPPKKQ